MKKLLLLKLALIPSMIGRVRWLVRRNALFQMVTQMVSVHFTRNAKEEMKNGVCTVLNMPECS